MDNQGAKIEDDGLSLLMNKQILNF